MSLPSYVVWFRGDPACPCLAEWLPVFEGELLRRGVIRESIDIAQLIGDAEASGNTHRTGGAADIWQHDPVTVWVARQMGADAAWARTTGSWATSKHTHLVLSGCPHNIAARYQIDEVRAGGDGLLGTAPDPGPRPLSGRTWRQGIAWAKAQTPSEEEEIMAAADDIINAIKTQGDRIVAAVEGVDTKVSELRHKEAQRFVKQIKEDRDAGQTLDEILAALESGA